jgi:hypothetical protein
MGEAPGNQEPRSRQALDLMGRRSEVVILMVGMPSDRWVSSHVLMYMLWIATSRR